MGVKFGVAGNSDSFYAEGNKASEQMPAWLAARGLDAYEYQCGNGVRVKEKTAEIIGANASENKIIMSVHSPYYINLATPETEKRESSIRYIMQSAKLVKQLGGNRVVVHSGSLGKLTREEALSLAKETVTLALSELKNEGMSDVRLCIETMGKIKQLGNLDEVIELCRLDESLLPCIDFGHLNARTLGSISDKGDYVKILDSIKNRLGSSVENEFHAHFSKIEYTEKGGEKKHLTFADEVFGPGFEPLGEVLYERGISPTIICESAGTQAEDAASMKRMYISCGGVK